MSDTEGAGLTVPNGTDISDLEAFVTRYRGFVQKSAEGILGLAETVLQAKSVLSDAQLNDFCEKVRLDRTGSTYRKLIAIGEAAARFKPFIERMPPNWTTMHRLAALNTADFDRLSEDDRFTSATTSSEIDQILHDLPEAGPGKFSSDFSIDASGVDQKRELSSRFKTSKPNSAVDASSGRVSPKRSSQMAPTPNKSWTS